MLKWLTGGPQEAVEAAPVEDRTYTDIVTNALVEAAVDNLVDGYVSAMEIAAGQLSRAFTSGLVTGGGAAAFNPWTMGQIGRSLVEDGEAIWYRVGQDLRRAYNYDFLPAQRSYQISNPGSVMTLPAARVFHARWNVEINSGRGLGPLGTARTLRRLFTKLEGSLETEANAAVGYLLPVPVDGKADTITQLKEDLANLKGRIALAETVMGGWGDATQSTRRKEFELARLGPNYPEGNVRLYQVARDTVLAACGYPVSLATDSDGTGQREAWRRYLHGTVAPLGRLVETEAARIGLPVQVDFETLFASDIAGRARAFQSLVGGGMDVAQAAALSGLMSPED